MQSWIRLSRGEDGVKHTTVNMYLKRIKTSQRPVLGRYRLPMESNISPCLHSYIKLLARQSHRRMLSFAGCYAD